MKKLSVFGIIALMLVGLAANAFAADIKATGKWQIEAQNRDNMDFNKSQEENTFDIQQRVRTAFQFIANENLKGVLDTQIGTAAWGNNALAIGSGRTPNVATNYSGATVAGDGNIMLRQGYVDFKWPGTKVQFKVGYQTVGLPAAVGGGSAILDDQVAAAVMVTPLTDNLKLLAGYARPYDSQAFGAASSSVGHGTSTDMVFAAVPIDFKGFNFTPFAAYGNSGYRTTTSVTTAGVVTYLGGSQTAGFAAPNATSNEGVRVYFGGLAATITALDNFTIKGDFNYGKATYNSGVNNIDAGRSGWLGDIAVDYTGLKMMTPSLFFVYSSGEDGNSSKNAKSERMPFLGNPQSWAVGSFFFGDRDFANGFSANNGYFSKTQGFWTAGLSLKDITFLDKLKHTVHLLYIKGTNDKDFIKDNNAGNGYRAYGGILTEKDSLWEVDFNTKYMIYDELSVYLNLGYINQNYDKDLWRASGQTNAATIDPKDAYRVGLGVTYAF